LLLHVTVEEMVGRTACGVSGPGCKFCGGEQGGIRLDRTPELARFVVKGSA
jgi:hypothetical protein